MNYEIKGGDFPVLLINLESGETITTEGGAMAWMSPNMEMATEGGGSFGKALGRLFSGEKIFRNQYTATGGRGLLAITAQLPGSILAMDITPSTPLIVQKSSFLACTEGVSTEVFFNKKASTGLFAGEGFIMQKVFGNGTVFLEVDGSTMEYELESGQSIIVDTGNLAMMDVTCTMDIQSVKGVKNVLFGGEGLFNTVITGPGKVTLQTMSVRNVAEAIIPYLPSQSSSSD
jgi:uncharacterized protein (TIGR00266 family)